MPIQETVKGSDLRYWDFKSAEGKGDWVKKAVDVQVTVADPKAEDKMAEIMALVDNNLDRLIEVLNEGIKAEATEKQGAVPEGCFSPAMVSAADKMMRMTPQFSGIKKSAERRRKVMEFIGSNETMRTVYAQTLESLRTAKNNDSDDDE